MRLLASILAALMLAAAQPAWAFTETLPGDEEWPEIPSQIGVKAFLGKWLPQCNHGAYIENGDMIVHEDGRISYEAKEPYLATRYRVIETTPYYVVTLVQTPEHDVHFWAFRPLGKSFRPRGSTDMSTFGLNECPVYGDDTRREAIWNFTDAELDEFWKTNKFCQPSLTRKSELNPFWGGRWFQPCYYAR